MFKKIVLTATILAAFTLLIVFKANAAPFLVTDPQSGVVGDRKSTRLNSSHRL